MTGADEQVGCAGPTDLADALLTTPSGHALFARGTCNGVTLQRMDVEEHLAYHEVDASRKVYLNARPKLKIYCRP